MSDNLTGTEIAIIGMAGRYPKSRNLDELWRHLHNGNELITFFTDEDLAAHSTFREQIKNPYFVKAAGALEDTERFDAAFFGILPREAELMDPQHRLFLECAWEALEHAGYAPQRYNGLIGVYAGAVENTYLLFNLMTHPEVLSMGLLPVMVVNGRDYMPTRVSYKLNLRGPSCLVQSACSTSLVAIHTACQSLLNRECDIALAGGVSVLVNQRMGYTYTEGGILSPDGHCRTFDAKSEGTIFGSGIGIVVLKPLENALADGDTIHAVILGSAVNNDGSLKVSYTAPSISGQAEVIIEALANAGIGADTISYIEAHGTATAMGDTIEVQALTQAFRTATDKKGFCAIGTVKTNLGHLDAAAGVTGVLKTVLALKHRQLPPSLHFEQPNPKIDFANSPFYVSARLSEWPAGPTPRRAGVNSFGIGGTNTHMILEEAPVAAPTGPSRAWQVLMLSAKTETALEAMTANLAAHLRSLSSTSRAPEDGSAALNGSHTNGSGRAADSELADVTYTLQIGRTLFNHRRAVVCHSADDAIVALESLESRRVLTHFQEQQDRPVAFLFPGQGAQYPHMSRGLYKRERLFRDIVDRCAELLHSELGLDLREVLYPDTTNDQRPTTNDQRPTTAGNQEPRTDDESETQNSKLKTQNSSSILDQTQYTQPALFVVEYALARLWQSWGMRPRAMIGHSIGEYVAACLAGVFSLEDALRLVAQRGRLIQQLPRGSMLSVSLPEAEVRPLLQDGLSLAAVNAPKLCVVSGPDTAIDALQALMEVDGIQTRRLHTSHAFHSSMMEPILEAFAVSVGRVTLHAPEIPFLSNLTGTWITAEQATDPQYWVQHVRQTVHFAECLRVLLADADPVLLEVGPGRTLSTFARQQPAAAEQRPAPDAFPSLRHPNDKDADDLFLLTTLGRLWLSGVAIDWGSFYAGERRRRVPLPTYPFERQRFWIDPYIQTAPAHADVSPGKKPHVADWIYAPYWKPSATPAPDPTPATWLVFGQPSTLRHELTTRLRAAGHKARIVQADAADRDAAAIDPQRPSDYIELLASSDAAPQRILYCADQAFDVYGLLYLAQALGRRNIQGVQLNIITQGAQQVTRDAAVDSSQALVLGPALVIPQEYPGVTCRAIDIAAPRHAWGATHLYDSLLAELTADVDEPVLAYCDGQRLVQSFEPLHVQGAAAGSAVLRQGGTYIITGGLGRIGRVLSRYLAESVGAKLALISRAGLPPRDMWDDWLAAHEQADPASDRIRFVQELEAAGAEVLVLAADVADGCQMRTAIAQAEQRFGALHGVIHAAGIMEEQKAFVLIQDLTRATCEVQFRPKVAGTLVLAELLRDRVLDFCLLFSSTATLLGGLGFAAYAAANRFMDAIAQQQRHIQPTPWLCVDWDGWLFAGYERESGVGASAVEQAMSPEEGIQALTYVLGLTPLARVVVSTGDVQARLEHWVKRRRLDATARPAATLISRYARPALQNAYVAPRNDIETTLVEIWQQLLGISQVGVHDHFFDLGGHSLLATQLMSQVRDAFATDLSIRQFFEAPTVAELALAIVGEQVGGAVDEQDLSTLLDQIEHADDDQLAQLLAEDAG